MVKSPAEDIRVAAFGLALFGQGMILIPPGVRRPVNGGAVALGGAAFQPVVTRAIRPDAHGMAIELLFARIN